jgi:hypothetical protein
MDDVQDICRAQDTASFPSATEIVKHDRSEWTEQGESGG